MALTLHLKLQQKHKWNNAQCSLCNSLSNRCDSEWYQCSLPNDPSTSCPSPLLEAASLEVASVRSSDPTSCPSPLLAKSQKLDEANTLAANARSLSNDVLNEWQCWMTLGWSREYGCWNAERWPRFRANMSILSPRVIRDNGFSFKFLFHDFLHNKMTSLMNQMTQNSNNNYFKF